MPQTAPRPVLVADIGGTNTRVALADGPRLRAGSVRRFRNADHAGLGPILDAYVHRNGPCAGACVAGAGPVHDGALHLTNLDWTITPDLLRGAIGDGPVAILNDLQAQGHALGHLPAGTLRPLLAGRAAEPKATRLVIGIGTGFNAAPVHDTTAGRLVPPCESGHVTLPVQDDETLALARFLAGGAGFAGVEDALSGRGLENLYTFTARQLGHPARMAAPEIMPAAADDPAASTALGLFARILGTVAGDLALTHLPFGGIHLCGGVARALAPTLLPNGFARAFHAKGRFGALMAEFPVHVIVDDDAALYGCAARLAFSLDKYPRG